MRKRYERKFIESFPGKYGVVVFIEEVSYKGGTLVRITPAREYTKKDGEVGTAFTQFTVNQWEQIRGKPGRQAAEWIKEYRAEQPAIHVAKCNPGK